MKGLTTIASAAALAMSLAASVTPAHAAVFAHFTPDTNARDFRWINSGPGDNGTGGHFFSIKTQNSTVAQGVATHFSFVDPALSVLAFLPATFTVDATVAAGNPASVNGAGVWAQTSLNGSFSFIYSGATINNFMGSGIDLIHGSNLLSGVFSNAWIQGSGGSGSFNLAHGNGGVATYSSDYESFSHVAPGTEEFAFNLLSTTPAFVAKPGKALKGFRANGGGNFSFEAVPEPASWGLMIVGFAGLGGLIRSRRERGRTMAA
jgi:hypothetical protein